MSSRRRSVPFLQITLVAFTVPLVIALPLPATAQTLTEALSYAYNNNPQLLAQRASLRATDEQVPQALSGWRPTVNFAGSAGEERAGLAVPGSVQCPSHNPGQTCFSSFQTRELDLRITQPVYNGGRTEAQTKQAVNTVEATRAQTLAVETMVFQAVVQAFFDVYLDQTQVEVNRNNEAVLKKQLDATRDRFHVGDLTRTDVAQAESALAQATAQRINFEGKLESDRAAFVRAVGHPPGRLVLPTERPALPASRDEALALAATNNPNVIAANFAEAAARDNVDVVRGQLLPQISIVGDLNRSFSPSVTQRTARQDTASVVAQMTMPLYEGGAIYSQTRAADKPWDSAAARWMTRGARRYSWPRKAGRPSWRRVLRSLPSRGGEGGANRPRRHSAGSTGWLANRAGCAASDQQLFNTQLQLAASPARCGGRGIQSHRCGWSADRPRAEIAGPAL